MARSNCLLFFLALRRRRLKRGKRGGLYVRKSHNWWGPHFIYQYKNRAGKHRMVSFVPVNPKRCLFFPPLKFEGRIQWGD